MFSLKELFKIVLFVIFPNIGGIFNGRIVRDNLDPWFKSLIQPSWNPPSWVFAPVWTAIYCSIGIASYLVYREINASAKGWDRAARWAFALYLVQMIFNWAWVPIFFGMHSLKWVRTFTCCCAGVAINLKWIDCYRAVWHLINSTIFDNSADWNFRVSSRDWD